MQFSLPVAYFFWLISGFGALGFHRFYLRKFPTAVLWLFTGGLSWLGAIYDFFTLPNQVREANLRAGVREALDLNARARFISVRGALPTEEQKKESIERLILKTAKKNNGYVTPGEVAIEGDVTIDEARAALDKLAAKGFAELRVRASGVVVYSFEEFVRTPGGDEFIA